MTRFNLASFSHHLLHRLPPAGATARAETPVLTGAEKLARLWADALCLDRMGINDDFFALGGDSLLALEVLGKIDKLYGKKVPLSAMNQAKTPREFVELLGAAEPASEWESLVLIQPGTMAPPLFCVHPIGGDVMGFHALASHLAPEQPVYALRARGVDGVQEPHETVEEMARHYLTEIRQVQPDGPYYLCGYSFGGLVAYEMARQLEAEGEQTALLGILDSRKPAAPPPVLKTAGRLLTSLSIAALTKKVWNQLAWLAFGLKVKSALALHKLTRRALPQGLAHIHVTNCCARAGRCYAPGPYSGKVTLFRAAPLSAATAARPLVDWSQCAAGGTEMVDVRSEHNAMLNEPFVQDLAAKMTLCLKQVQESDTRR